MSEVNSDDSLNGLAFNEYHLKASVIGGIGKCMAAQAMPHLSIPVWVNQSGKLKVTSVIVNVWDNSLSDITNYIGITLKSRGLYFLAVRSMEFNLDAMKKYYPSLIVEVDEEGLPNIQI